MQTTTAILVTVHEKLRLLLLTILACTIVSACSGGGSSLGENSQRNLPNPYANGYRVVQVITTFFGEPWSIEDYVYNQENNTFVLNKIRGDEIFTDLQILDSSGLIDRSGNLGEDNSLVQNDSTREYGYNENGQLISRIGLNGFPTFRYIRDAQGNLIQRNGGGAFEYTYDVNGLLETVSNTQTQELYVIEYNVAGQISGGATSFDDGSLFNGFELLYDENGNLSQVTNYDRVREPIFTDRYIYEETDEIIVNHGLMRLLNTLPDLTIPPF